MRMDAHEFEKKKRRFDADFKAVNDHNESLERSRAQGVADAIVDFNAYARPYILGEMNGTPHRPYAGIHNKDEAYRRNYDRIDWGKK